ncbi:MAG: GNAT family N-acetyltransferase [Dehalococcoidia bacterium]|nr:GNAT family N-acetyltransferase [Dehalococcoidia bacterium]
MTYPSEEGHGYASELASGLVEWALAERGAPAVLATIPPAHHASIRVAERAGLVPAGTAVDAEVGEVLVFRRDR